MGRHMGAAQGQQSGQQQQQQRRGLSSSGGWRDPLAAGATRRANEYVCELCQVITSSQDSLRSHQNGRAHKRAAKKAQAEAEGRIDSDTRHLSDTRQQRVGGWDGTLLADGSHDDEPQVACYYDKSHDTGKVMPVAAYYSGAMAKKRSAATAAAEAAGSGGAKRGAGGGADGEPAAQRKKGNKPIDPVAQYRRRIGLANRDGSLADGLAAFDELHAAGHTCETKTGNSVLSLCAAAGENGYEDAVRVYAVIKERYTPDEGSFTCMIRLCGITNQLEKGMELFDEMCAAGIAPKRRTYEPLYEACAEQPDGALLRALALLADSRSRDIETYEGAFASIVRSCARAGPAGVLPCQEVVLPQMMDDCYTLCASTRAAVEEWAAGVEKRAAPLVSKPDKEGKVSGHALQSLALTAAETKIMLAQVSSLAQSDKKKTAQFLRFRSFIEKNEPFDVLLDGANIGFSNQRVDKGGKLQWSQIERVVAHFMHQGLTHPIPPQPRVKPLVILHERHFYNERSLSRADQEIIARWRNAGILYVTPKQMNDDWFWLYAGVLAGGRNPASIIISNDQMRDHHFQMLSMKYFLKWRERHWVNFEFFDRERNTKPTFDFPTPYSIRMQPVDGAWFFPLNDKESPVAQEGGRPEEGKPTGEWLACLPAEGETTPPASRSAEGAATASAEQIARWKAEAPGGEPAAAAAPEKKEDAPRGEKRKATHEPGRAQQALEKLNKAKKS